MAGENDGGTKAATQLDQTGQADAQAQQQQAGQPEMGVGQHAKAGGDISTSGNGGASEGNHAADGAYQEAIKQRDAKIAELEEQIAKAAETKETAEKLTAEIAELKQQSADERVSYELRLAGARNVTAAKALLSEHDGDVSALKEAEPWLFETESKDGKKQSGTTGLEPAGATGASDATMKRWERIAGLTDDE